jgi:glycine cleavage system H protein
MSEIPDGFLYTEQHEYLRPTEEDGVYLVGITDFAQGELGDIVYVELPAEGDSFAQMAVFGTIEAVKAVNDLFCPVSGEILEVNAALDQDPALVNTDPYGEGWMVRLRVADPGELEDLLDEAGYRNLVGEG